MRKRERERVQLNIGVRFNVDDLSRSKREPLASDFLTDTDRATSKRSSDLDCSTTTYHSRCDSTAHWPLVQSYGALGMADCMGHLMNASCVTSCLSTIMYPFRNSTMGHFKIVRCAVSLPTLERSCWSSSRRNTSH